MKAWRKCIAFLLTTMFLMQNIVSDAAYVPTNSVQANEVKPLLEPLSIGDFGLEDAKRDAQEYTEKSIDVDIDSDEESASLFSIDGNSNISKSHSETIDNLNEHDEVFPLVLNMEDSIDSMIIDNPENKSLDEQLKFESIAEASFKGSISAPKNLIAKFDGTELVLSWDKTEELGSTVSYEVYRDGNSVTVTDLNIYIDTDIIPGTLYTYVVKAYDEAGNVSEASAPVRNDTGLPAAIQSLKVVSHTPTTVSLSWDASTDNTGVEIYKIYRNGEVAGETKDTSFVDSALKPNTEYIYTVKAFDVYGNESLEGNKVTVVTDKFEKVDRNSISGGGYHSLVIREDGKVLAWGRNESGQLGNGTQQSSNIPVEVKDLEGIIAVEGGYNHSAAIKEDGTVWTWGSNSNGQLGLSDFGKRTEPAVVKGLTGVTDVSCGYYHTVAVNDGKVWAWGNNAYGQIGDGGKGNNPTPVMIKGLDEIISVSAGYGHTLALKADGTVWALGSNGYGQLGDGTLQDSDKPVQVKELTDIVAISAGAYHCVALKSDGTVWTWGQNAYGQLGDGTKVRKNTPVKVEGLSGIIDVKAGEYFTMAFSEDGTVWAWGFNRYGQLGDGTNTDKNVPCQVKGLSKVKEISAGLYHSMALLEDGSVWSWGYNEQGELADGTNINRNSPVLSVGIKIDNEAPTAPTNLTVVEKTATTVSLEWEASSDNISVAGYDVYRDGVKIGTTKETKFTDTGLSQKTTYIYTVKAFDLARNYSSDSNEVSSTTETVRAIEKVPLACGKYSTVIIKEDGSVYAAGYNYISPNTRNKNYYIPVKVPGIEGVDAVACGELNMAFIKPDGSLWTGGSSSDWVLGRPYDNNFYNAVTELTGVTAVACGPKNTVVVNDGMVWAWGDNNYGQVGDGTNQRKDRPVQVKGLYGIIDVAVGNNSYEDKYFTAALKNDGTVWTWGNNEYGQLGDGTTVNKNRPVQVQGLSDVIEIACGGLHIVALKSDGTVWTWGYNGYGQLGDGTTTNRSTPVKVKGLTGVIAIAAGKYHTVALKSDGTVWAWGRNNRGQIGDGTQTDRYEPVQVEEIKGVTAIACGESHTAVLKSDGTVWAWGHNGYGQLGNGSNKDSAIPVLLGVDTEAPTPPTELIVIADSEKADLTWKASEDLVGVAGYYIYRNGEIIATVTENSYQDMNIVKGEAYTYVVKAFDEAGNISEPSNETKYDIEAPSVPENLRIVDKSCTTVSLEWDASSDNVGVTGYEIFRGDTYIGTSVSTNYVDKGLEPNTTYTYTVRAYDAGKNYSGASKALEVTTVEDTEPPTVPGNLYINYSNSSYVLHWNPSTDNVAVAGYYVYRDGVEIANVSSNYYHDSDLKYDKECTYTVRAYDTFGNVSDESASFKFKDDYGNTKEEAFPIELAQDITGSIDYSYDNDIFNFTAPISGTYMFTIKSSIYIYVYVYQKDGNVIYLRSVTEGSFLLDLNKDEKYYLRIEPYWQFYTGKYSFIITPPLDT